MSRLQNHPLMPYRQRGATLFVAIIMLLLITLLALTGIKSVTLESRITANLTQQKDMFNAAEAGLRIGETTLGSPLFNVVQDVSSSCDQTKCLPYALANISSDTAETVTHFTSADASANRVTTYINTSDIKFPGFIIQWYMVDLGPLKNSLNNSALTGESSPRYYEIDSCATKSTTTRCTDNTTEPRVILRSVFAKVY